MKKLYILTCSLAISIAAIGQVQSQMGNNLDYSKKINNVESTDVNQATSLNRMSSSLMPNIVWESDFSDPLDWVLDNSGQNPPVYGWSIDANSDGWWSNTGINSTSGGNYAELSNGDAQAGTQAAAVTYTMTTSQSIDIYGSIGSGNATLSFEEYGARFYDLQEVQISIDNVNFIAVGDNQAYSQLTACGGSAYTNPTLREINLSPYLGATPSTVWVRFSWTSALNLSPADVNYSNTWITYGWYIDDVKITESPANKVTMHDVFTGGWHIDYANYSGSGLNDIYGLDYSVTPLSQVQSHPYAIEALFINEGTASQTVNLTYDVTGAAASNGSSNAEVLNPGDSVLLGASFSPVSTGSYSIDIWGSADSAGAGVVSTLSNIETKEIEVSDYTYGKDLGVTNPMSSWKIGGQTAQWHFTTRFEMYANEQLYALRAYITNESAIGAEVKAIIYEADTTSADGLLFLDESDNYTITAADRGSWVDIPFLAPISLTSGYAYEFGIVGFQHPTDTVFLGTSGQSVYNGEHSLFDEFGLNPNDPANTGTPTWYYTTATPMVRMNFDPSLISKVTNLENTIFNIYPNPSNGMFTIELDNSKKYNVRINNLLGQTIYATTTSNMKTFVDLSNFGKGIYTIELQHQDKIFTEQIIIE